MPNHAQVRCERFLPFAVETCGYTCKDAGSSENCRGEFAAERGRALPVSRNHCGRGRGNLSLL